MTSMCEICMNNYKTYPSWGSLRRTCSRVCAARLKSIEKCGENHPMYGKKHSLKSLELMSLNRKGKGQRYGAENPAYGKPAWNKGLYIRINSGRTHFMKGIVPWNKGKEFLAIRGPGNWRWRGGITESNLAIRSSIEYKRWRRAVFERDNFTCQMCSRHGGNLEADHIKGFAQYPELRFDVGNGRTLCKPCHRKTDNWGNKGRDNLGRFVPLKLQGDCNG